MFNFEEYSLNESLAPSIGDYNLVKSPRGNYYQHKNEDYKINDSWIIESNGYISSYNPNSISFANEKFKYIPFLFNKSKKFYLLNCENLVSLKGCPNEIENDFICMNAFITSLEDAPQKVGKDYSLEFCKYLKSLKNCQSIIHGNFNISFCEKLDSFEGMPIIIDGNFNCGYCTNIKYIDHFFCKIKGRIDIEDQCPVKKQLQMIRELYNQYPILNFIEDYALFVHTVIGYAPELKQYYKEIPELSTNHQDLSTFL